MVSLCLRARRGHGRGDPRTIASSNDATIHLSKQEAQSNKSPQTLNKNHKQMRCVRVFERLRASASVCERLRASASVCERLSVRLCGEQAQVGTGEVAGKS